MNSRSRVMSTLKNKVPDRPPLDGWFLNGVLNDLKKHFNTIDDEIVLENLGIDFRGTSMIPAPSFGEKVSYFKKMGLSIPIADYYVRKYGTQELEDEWGVRIKITGEEDLNWKYSYHPLNKGGELSIVNLKLPNLKAKSRFDKVKRDIEKYKEKYIIVAGSTTLFRKGWILCGFSRFLEALYTDTDFVNKLLDTLTEYIIEEVSIYIKEGVDIIQFGGDLGSEKSLMISPDLWREIFKPRLKKIIDKTKKEGVYFYLHSDGNIKPLIPDLIEIGINILNPIQPECMDPKEIKKEFGDKITLHGTMSLQKTFSFGDNLDIKGEVFKRINECGDNGGLILAPSNAFTSDIPLSNITYFYDLVKNMSLSEILK